MNVRINEADAVVLREHIEMAHQSLLDPVVDGPLYGFLYSAPIEVLAAVHTANHMVPWRDHPIDHWLPT